MGKFFIGRETELLTEEQEERIKIHYLHLLRPELGHMPCRREEAMAFVYVCEGSLACRINQEEAWLQAGEACFINTGQAYRFTDCGEPGCGFYLVEMAPGYLAEEQILKEKYVTPIARSDAFCFCVFSPTQEGDSDEDILLGAIASAAETARIRATAYELDLKSWMLTAWVSLYRKYLLLSPACKNSVIRERAKLLRMVDSLSAHYQEKLTLTQLAQACEVSSGEYCRFFKKHMGVTPFEYLQKCRIAHSMDELLEKAGSMTDVALHNGFAGASYYAETFKKEMGCSPGDYRKWYFGRTDRCPLKVGKTQNAKTQNAPQKESAMPSHLL